MPQIDLGFAEKCPSWRLQSSQFPSKIGGKPAWLSFEQLPKVDALLCSICNNPKTFLCQIYAPFEECDQNFHRTLYIFVCRSPSCGKKNQSSHITVLRSNLPRENKFYLFHQQSNEGIPFDPTEWCNLCALCGCRAEKTCSKCKSTNYCSREHQVKHWKESHKHICSKEMEKKVNDDASKHLLEEFEIVIDPEEVDERKEVNIDEQVEKYEALKAAGKVGTLSDLLEDDLDKYASVDGDKTFTRFKQQVAHNPDQIVRYERGGEPLWIAKQPIPENIPNCELCSCPRQFEFQIMPQVLAILKEEHLDFGVLAIYTCSKSCWEHDGYKVEFVFKQDISE